MTIPMITFTPKLLQLPLHLEASHANDLESLTSLIISNEPLSDGGRLRRLDV